MKKIGASVFLAVGLSAAFAQTDPPAARPLSLQDCFAAALQNNFDVRIQRFNPQISELNVSAAYGAYDPAFTFSGQHNYNDQGAQVQTGGNLITETITRENAFNSGLNGATPWGMTYNFSGNISQLHDTKVLGSISTNFDSSSGSFGVNVTQPLLKNF